MVKMLGVVLFFGLLLVVGVYIIDTSSKYDPATRDAIKKSEKLYEESLDHQLPIEEQLEELRRVEIKLYGKETSHYYAILDKQ